MQHSCPCSALEAAAGGEFGVGTAQQVRQWPADALLCDILPDRPFAAAAVWRGGPEWQGFYWTGRPTLSMCHINTSHTSDQQWPGFLQDLRRSNFTSADCRNANFKGANLQGTYFIKAVTAKANFEVSVEGASHGPSLSSTCGASFRYTPVSGQARLPRAPPIPVLHAAANPSPQLALQGANLSDSLMDRAVIVGANLKNANLTRAVFTRWGAICLGASCLLVSCSTFVGHALSQCRPPAV